VPANQKDAEAPDPSMTTLDVRMKAEKGANLHGWDNNPFFQTPPQHKNQKKKKGENTPRHVPQRGLKKKNPEGVKPYEKTH